jgi:hypothetical protein
MHAFVATFAALTIAAGGLIWMLPELRKLRQLWLDA